MLINGKTLAQSVRAGLKNEIKKMEIKPKLAVIMVGNDPASVIYVRNKSKACEEIGIKFEETLLDENISQEQLLDVIDKLNVDDSVTGILLQYPIPKHLNLQEAFERISPKKDVDGFNPTNIGLRTIGADSFVPCTPFGIIKMLEEYNIDVEGKRAVVLGRSNTVGKPIAMELLHKNATVTTCHSKTRDIDKIIGEADILVSAIGKAKFVKGDWIKEGAVVIDVGMNRDENGKLCGDVDFEAAEKRSSYITPVPRRCWTNDSCNVDV